MATPPFPPPTEAGLLAWSSNFSNKLTATPVAIGITAPMAAAYAALHATFSAAYVLAIDPDTNSRTAIQAKNTAKENLVSSPGGARELIAIIQAFPGTTDEMRTELGLKIRDVHPTPVPVPRNPPTLTIVSTLGRTVKVRLRDLEDPDRRALPDGVDGASVLSFVGDEAPDDPMEWSLMMNVSRTTFDVEFPVTVAAGSKVWLTAFWFNQRKEAGPGAAYQSTVIAGGLAAAA
jgi:hypothetical protein